MKCFQITITGKVTHKGFRFGAMQMAYKLGIKGFVQYKKKNCILIEAEGKEQKLKKFIEWCEKGPNWARVDDIQSKEVTLKGYPSFIILHKKHPRSDTDKNIDNSFKRPHQETTHETDSENQEKNGSENNGEPFQRKKEISLLESFKSLFIRQKEN